MAGGGHQKQNQQGKKAQNLKRKILQRAIVGIGSKNRKDRINIAQTVKLDDVKNPMHHPNQKCSDPQMPSVVQQWQKTMIQTRHWPNAQNELQHDKGQGTGSPNDQGFRADQGIKGQLQEGERQQV